jgi:hypothetical protein
MERTELPISPAMRDRLIWVATLRGMSVEELLVSLIGPPETLEELRAKAQKTHDYIKEHLCPEIDDYEGPGCDFWAELEAGRIPQL